MEELERATNSGQLPKTVAVIDGNSLMHRAFHAVPDYMTAPDGTPTGACFGFMSMLIKLVETLHPDGVICAFDGGIPAFRLEAIEEYKAQRPPTDPKLKAQFPVIEELLRSLRIPVIRVDTWEGDDILGTVGARAEAAGIKSLLVSGDRDVLQLVTEQINVVTTRKGLTDIIIYTPEAVEERYGVRPDQVPDYLGLKGDTSDNYPGIPGIGEKTAAKLLQQYGTLEEILAHASEQKGKLGERLADPANVELAYLSRRAATISHDVPVELDFADAFFPRFDAGEVSAVFGRLALNQPLYKLLALGEEAGIGGIGGAGGVGAGAPPVELVLEPLVRGAEARAMVEDLLQGDEMVSVLLATQEAGEQLQLSIADDGADAGEHLYVACGKGVADLAGAAVVEEMLPRLLGRGGLQAQGSIAQDVGCLTVMPDLKELIRRVYPADTAKAAALDISQLEARVCFDLSVAAYLLDSSRSDYGVEALCQQYLRSALPEATDVLPQGAIHAAAALALQPALAAALEEDGSAGLFRDVEMPLVPVLARMERVGLDVDIDMLRQASAELGTRIDALRARAWELAGEEFNLDSPKQLGEVLFEKLGLPVQKKTQRGYSTDASVLETLAAKTESLMPGIVLEYRELAKMRSTYLDALPRQAAQAADGRIHTEFNQTVAATGRLSSSNPNLQNIPVRTELGRSIRRAFVPDASAFGGEPVVFLSADYSQIELRLLAHLSGDEGLIDSGEDFHAQTASRVFGVPAEEVTSAMRSKAKAVNFGIVYGQQAFGLGKSLHIPLKEAQQMIDRYYGVYPQVRAYLDRTVAEAKECGSASTMFGRKRHIHELRSSNHMTRAFGERTAMNHPMQGSAADIIKLAMIEVPRRMDAAGLRAQMVLQVHDELDFVCPMSEVETLSALVVDVMSNVAQLAVPLEVSVAYGPSWADAK